ncbi:uncharacterized serine/threonine-protein kinase SBK3 [Megalops cyprinoides]|uniref:uncharacterized serine/threonine-protein kinase SBK3 n=1 Tax=Megalops cyprinoides TaxID=118141 RepID=UPI0018651859|nr:uncharacterized serine/threonine-protein kinase SBK3 [Megalops cyprinoides]
MTAATQQLDELCYLTAQSLTSLETSDHFQIIKLLGEGSYGKVMLAVHRKRGTPMALKFFPRGSTSLLSFLREYNLSLTFCTHPSLTRALGIVFSTPSYYIFAQQAGLYGDLYDVIVGEEPMSEECVQRVVSQLSGAISHLHSLGFVHRDIKPENIFLWDKACRWVKLGDFGLARPQGTLVRAVWYDSPYCVPEVEVAKEKEEKVDREDTVGDGDSRDSAKREGDEVEENKKKKKKKKKKEVIWISVEPSIDSWALGILIYCMLTGCFPWEESTSDDPGYRQYKEWFERQTDSEEGSSSGTQGEWRETENLKGKREDIMRLGEGKRETGENGELDPNPIAPQFEVFSPLALSLFRQLLNPKPEHRAGPDEALGYLGGAWLLETEKEEKRRIREAEEEARKIREGGGVGEEKEREGRGER